MSKNFIKIDLDVWTTQAQFAKESGHSIQYINQLVSREKLEKFPIPQLNMVLIKRDKKYVKQLKGNQL